MGRYLVLVAFFLTVSACSGSDDVTETTPATAPPAASTTAPAPTTTTAPAEPTTTAVVTTIVTAPTTTTSAPAGSASLALAQIVFADDPYLTITNAGSGIGSTGGLWLSQFPTNWELPAFDLAPGETLGVSFTDAPVPDLIAITYSVIADGAIGLANPRTGEMGLYTNNAFTDPDAIVDYVEWGRPGHNRSPVAVEAGIWVSDGFVEMPDNVIAISAGGFPTSGPEAWSAEVGN